MDAPFSRSTPEQHDDLCEAEYVVGATGYTDCGCAERRANAGIDPTLLKMRVKRVRQAEVALAAVKRTLVTYITEHAPSRCEFHPLCGRERDGILVFSCGHFAVMCAHHGSEILHHVQTRRETHCTQTSPDLHAAPVIVTVEWQGL